MTKRITLAFSALLVAVSLLPTSTAQTAATTAGKRARVGFLMKTSMVTFLKVANRTKVSFRVLKDQVYAGANLRVPSGKKVNLPKPHLRNAVSSAKLGC